MRALLLLLLAFALPTLADGIDNPGTPSAVQSVAITATTDSYPTGGTITTQDVASATVQGQFNQNQTTGTPTANSTVSFAVAGYTTFTLGITGTWTGTVTIEGANAPAGITTSTVWTSKNCRVPGTTLGTSNFTANASNILCNVADYTHARIRATAAMTGTTTIGALGITVNLHAVDLINPVKIVDGSGTSSTLTIKAPSTAPQATDTAAVVTISPNTAYTSPNATTNGASTITAGGTFQTVLASSVTRKFWEFQNVCGKVGNCTAASDNCYLYLASSGSGTTANSIVVGPGSTYRESSGNIANDAVSATCDNTGDHYYLGSR